MSFLTERKLANILDIPVALPSTDLNQGDWIVLATVRITTPMKLTLRSVYFQMLSASVATTDIKPVNRVVPALGNAYVGLYQNYASSSPSTLVALDVLSISDVGVVTRPNTALDITTPGLYSILVVNNMQSSVQGTIPATTSIDFRLLVTGQMRLDLEAA